MVIDATKFYFAGQSGKIANFPFHIVKIHQKNLTCDGNLFFEFGSQVIIYMAVVMFVATHYQNMIHAIQTDRGEV